MMAADTGISRKSNTSGMLRDVVFADSNKGWVVGEDNYVIATKNGGKTWARQQYVSDFTLNGVWFVDNRRGWAVGEYESVLRTDDGGNTWREQTTREGIVRNRLVNDNRRVFFISDNVGWMGGSDGSIYHTQNGGARWQGQDSRIPSINGHVRETVNGVHFLDKKRGLAVSDIGFYHVH